MVRLVLANGQRAASLDARRYRFRRAATELYGNVYPAVRVSSPRPRLEASPNWKGGKRSSGSHPCGQRVSDKVKWAKEILALYGDSI